MTTQNKKSNPTPQPRNTRKPETTKKTPTAPEILQAYNKAQTDLKGIQERHEQKPTKATAKKLATAEKRLATLEKLIDDTGIITARNVQTIGERIAIKALKTIYQRSGENTIKTLYNGLCADINARKQNYLQPLSDGYDIAQTATAFLCAYIGKTLQTNADNGETNKDGNPVDVLRACFRAVNRYIMGHRQREYKSIYIDNPDTGELLQVPFEWDTPTYNDFLTVDNTINALNLTVRQKQILSYRLRGKSLHEIARILCVSRTAIQKTIGQIRTKYEHFTAEQKQN